MKKSLGFFVLSIALLLVLGVVGAFAEPAGLVKGRELTAKEYEAIASKMTDLTAEVEKPGVLETVQENRVDTNIQNLRACGARYLHAVYLRPKLYYGYLHAEVTVYGVHDEVMIEVAGKCVELCCPVRVVYDHCGRPKVSVYSYSTDINIKDPCYAGRVLRMRAEATNCCPFRTLCAWSYYRVPGRCR